MCYAEKEDYGEIMVEVISNVGGEAIITKIAVVPTFRQEDFQRSKQVFKRKLQLAIDNRIS